MSEQQEYEERMREIEARGGESVADAYIKGLESALATARAEIAGLRVEYGKLEDASVSWMNQCKALRIETDRLQDENAEQAKRLATFQESENSAWETARQHEAETARLTAALAEAWRETRDALRLFSEAGHENNKLLEKLSATESRLRGVEALSEQRREALLWVSTHAYGGGKTFADVPLVAAALAANAPAAEKFRAADHVKHGPSGETWVFACDQEGDDVYPAGWPESIAKASDCVLVQRASDAERIEMLRSAAKVSRPDIRASTASRQLAALESPRGDAGEGE